MSKAQEATLTMFLVFIILVIFIGKKGNGFWQALFTKGEYDFSVLKPSIPNPIPTTTIGPVPIMGAGPGSPGGPGQPGSP